VFGILRFPWFGRKSAINGWSDNNIQIREEPFYCESLLYGDEKISVRQDGYKYITSVSGARKEELYDLREDPEEAKNIIHTEVPGKDMLRKKLMAWYESNQKKAEAPESVNLDQATRDRLKSLGYVQ